MFSAKRANSYPIGDEPKPGTSMTSPGFERSFLAPKVATRGEKIGDELIKVLPDWKWDPVARTEFIDSFCRMIRCIHGRFMILNEMRSNPEHMTAEVLHEPAANSGFFSPRRERMIGRTGDRQDAAEPVQGLVSPYLSGGKRQVLGDVLRARLPRPDELYGLTPLQPTASGGMPRHAPPPSRAPPTGGATLEPVAQVSSPAAAAGVAEVNASRSPVAHHNRPLSGIDESDNWKDGKYDPVSDSETLSEAPSVASLTSAYTSQSSLSTASHSSHASRGSSRNSLRLGQAHQWDIPDVVAEDAASQHGKQHQQPLNQEILDRHRRAEDHAHARAELDHLAREVRQGDRARSQLEQETQHRFELELQRTREREGEAQRRAERAEQQVTDLSSRFETMFRELQSQRAHDHEQSQLEQQALREELSLAHNHTRAVAVAASKSDLYISNGAESWIIESNILSNFAAPHLWWCVVENRWEYAWESMLRTRVWAYLIKKLPRELWKSLNEGDVRGLYIHMLNLNSADSNSQILELQDKVLKFAKNGRPMRVWLDEFYDVMDKLDTLRAPTNVATVRTVIVESLKGDSRYKDALRDLKRNQVWDIPTIVRSAT